MLNDPKYLQGYNDSVIVFCQKAHEILDGKDDGRGVASEPWEALRRRLLDLAPDDVPPHLMPDAEVYDPEPAKCQYCGEMCNHNNKQFKQWAVTREGATCPDCRRKNYNPFCQGG